MVTTGEHEVDDISLLGSNLLRSNLRPGVPSWPAPTKTVMLAAETREGAKAAMVATTEAVESFMVLNVK